eukprot:5339993-Prymnesium_polylepis.1
MLPSVLFRALRLSNRVCLPLQPVSPLPVWLPAVCADLQEQSEVLYQFALRILLADASDPEPRAGPEQVKELTDGVIALAFSALQRAIGDATMPVPARRQQRVMSWLVCFATGVRDTVDGEMAQGGAFLIS